MELIPTFTKKPTRVTLSIRVFCVAVLCIASNLIAQPDRVRDQISEIQQAEVRLEQLETQMLKLRERLEKQSATIQDVRAKQAKGLYSPISDYRLDSLLRAAHEKATKLDRLEKRKIQIENEIKSKAKHLSFDIDKHVESLAHQLKDASLSAEAKEQIREELTATVALKSHLNPVDNEIVVRIPNPYLEPSDSDSEREMEQKLTVLSDMRDDIKSDLKKVTARIAHLRRQRVIFNEVRHLFDEESFFAETRFAKRQPSPRTTEEEEADGIGENASLSENGTLEAKNDSNTNEESVSTGEQDVEVVEQDETQNVSESIETEEAALASPSDTIVEPDLTGEITEVDTSTPDEVAAGLNPIRNVQINKVRGERSRNISLKAALFELETLRKDLKKQLKSIDLKIHDLETRIDSPESS